MKIKNNIIKKSRATRETVAVSKPYKNILIIKIVITQSNR